MTYIDEHKHLFGVEPICQILTASGWPIASSTYRAACRRQRSARVRRDAWPAERIRRIPVDDHGVYGARRVWLDGIALDAICRIDGDQRDEVKISLVRSM